jgi:hypothetical protein
VKNLNELFNQIRGIVDDPGDQNLDPDTAWFQDLQNKRDLHKDNPNAFAHYSPKTDTPSFPIVDPGTGRPSIKMMLRSLAQALIIQSENPTLPGVDDIVHKLEKIIIDYRQDLTEIPEYRVDLVKTKDTTPMVNNLIYGPHQPNTKLAVMVSDLSPNSSKMNLGSVDVNMNGTDNVSQDLPTQHRHRENDRVNVVQKTNDSIIDKDHLENLLNDIAKKTAMLAMQKRREEEREKTFTG